MASSRFLLTAFSPVDAFWVFPPMQDAHCLNEGKVMLGGGVINCISDLLITVLPIPIVARLQMPVKQRIEICILLCLGFIVTIAGIVRTYFIWRSLMQQYDETWWAYPLWIAAAVEVDLAVICACAPAWKSLRSPHSSKRSTPRSSSNGKPYLSNPLPTLPLFQITKFDFEKGGKRCAAGEGLSICSVRGAGVGITY
jgi:hypothetical protein